MKPSRNSSYWLSNNALNKYFEPVVYNRTVHKFNNLKVQSLLVPRKDSHCTVDLIQQKEHPLQHLLETYITKY